MQCILIELYSLKIAPSDCIEQTKELKIFVGILQMDKFVPRINKIKKKRDYRSDNIFFHIISLYIYKIHPYKSR